MTNPQLRLIVRLVDDFMHTLRDRKIPGIVRIALLEAQSAAITGFDYLSGETDMKDSKELRRYIGEVLQGAACMSMLGAKVPDSRRKPARLTIITLLKQWADKAPEYPVV